MEFVKWCADPGARGREAPRSRAACVRSRAAGRWLPADFPAWLIGSCELDRAQWATLIQQKIRTARAGLSHAFSSGAGSNGDEMPVHTRVLGDLFDFSQPQLEIARAQSSAFRRYTPRVYPGRVTLFRARMQPFFSSHASDKGWAGLAAGGLEVKVMPGNHLAMLQEPHVQVLAEQLKVCLDR